MVADFNCEICGGKEFFEFDYPTDLAPLKRKIVRGALRRYVVNPLKFALRIFFSLVPASFMPDLRRRAMNPYKKIQSFKSVRDSLNKLDRGILLFKGRKIAVCKNCELGFVHPRIPEEKLIDYYKRDYWISDLGELEPAESNRTVSTYVLLKEFIDFNKIKNALEFGSASAHLARFIKSKEPHLVFDCIDPGIIWKDVLKKEVNDIYTDLNQIDKKYDLIVSSHALEHVADLGDYFGKFIDLLKPGGYLYFEVPNSEERNLVFGDKPDLHFPHTYFFTAKAFRNIAARFGLEVIFTKTFNRSYAQIRAGEGVDINSSVENPKGAHLRVLFRKKL